MIQKQNDRRFQVLIVGGGAAGISVAARLAKASPRPDVAIVEPSDKHYYQPLWTLVGGGEVRKETTERAEADLIPRGTTWIRDRVETFLPDENAVLTASGERLGYDALVVAPGIQLNWGAVAGLQGRVGRGGICSNYSYATVDSTWEAIRGFQGGTAVFTHPATPIKCGGAPQKIMYLAADHWRRNPPREAYRIVFCIGMAKIFSVDHYARSLLKAVERYGIEVRYQQDLVAVDADARTATFRHLETGETTEQPWTLLHVTPPMSAPDFVRASPLANEAGWLDADKHTLRHPRWDNVFALGDASSLPTSKTGAAVRKQAPVAAANVLATLRGAPLTGSYDGYTSCPLVTGYGRLVMAEFDYDLALRETFPIDQSVERRSMYLVKKHLLPQLYWRGMLKGRA